MLNVSPDPGLIYIWHVSDRILLESREGGKRQKRGGTVAKGRRAEKQEEERNNLGARLLFGVQIITILAKAIIYQTLTSVTGQQPFYPAIPSS